LFQLLEKVVLRGAAQTVVFAKTCQCPDSVYSQH